MSRKNTEQTITENETTETTVQESEPIRSNTEVTELSYLNRYAVSPLAPKDPDDGWSYYWAIEHGSETGSATAMRLRGFEKVKAHSDAEIPTWGGVRNERGEVVYGSLVLMKRPKEYSEKEMEAKRREYRRLANQKDEEFKEAMEREGAEYHPERTTFFFANNPLAK